MTAVKAWLRTSRVALAIALVPAVTLSILAGILIERIRTEGPMLEAGYFSFWHRTLPYAALAMLIVAPVAGFLNWREKESLTLEGWWPKARSFYRVAFSLTGLLWIEGMIAQWLPGWHERWIGLVEEPIRFLMIHLAWIVAVLAVVVVGIFFARPLVRGYRGK